MHAFRKTSLPFLIYIEYLSGFILTILFLYLLGLLVSNVIGKKLYKAFENLLDRIPIINKIYISIKQITSTLSTSGSNKAFEKVVIIEYPRKGLWTMAMVTGRTKNIHNSDFYNIFVPTTPNPTSGYLIFIKKKDVIETSLSVEEGLKIIISGGLMSPDSLNIP